MRRPKKILSVSSALGEAVEVFKTGGVIAYPTETFYGLCVDPFNKKAIERLFSLKGREAKAPVSVIVRDEEMLASVVASVPSIAHKLMEKFWPGPLTIIFEAGENVPPELISHTGKIAVRVSSSPVAAKLTEIFNSPITATSANPSGKPPAATAEEVIAYFNGSVDLLIDGGKVPGEAASTIVDVTGGEIRIIRVGVIPDEEIKRKINKE